jgi:hypothetical protein
VRNITLKIRKIDRLGVSLTIRVKHGIEKAFVTNASGRLFECGLMVAFSAG